MVGHVITVSWAYVHVYWYTLAQWNIEFNLGLSNKLVYYAYVYTLLLIFMSKNNSNFSIDYAGKLLFLHYVSKTR